ncbi:MAG: sugar ABC transporter permease [Rhodospirillaceae bacterium]|nr:sugar ABC transporter permease [Rhodospirillaceae bacterium]
MQVKQEHVPVLDEQGNPVLDESGQPRTKLQVKRQNVTTYTFQGLFNYVRAFHDGQVGSAVRVSAVFALVAVPTQIVLGILLALLFNRPLPARGVLRVAMMLPIFATPIAVGYLFFTIFYEEGGPLAFLHVPFLSNPDWALFSVVLVDIWQWTPFCFLVFLAALQGMPDEAIEMARLDTNSRWRIFWGVVFPLLQPTIVIVLLLRLAEALKLFDIPFALTGGGPGIATQSYSFLAFRVGLRYFDVGYASALAYGLLIVVMIIVTLFFKRLRQSYA